MVPEAFMLSCTPLPWPILVTHHPDCPTRGAAPPLNHPLLPQLLCAQITSLEWSTSKLRGPHGPTHVLATAGMDGRVRLWAAPQKLV